VTEPLRKGPIVAVVADSVPRAPVVVEAGTARGRGVDANIVDRRTVSGTTTDCPGRTDRANERTVGGRPVDSQDLGKTGWTDTQNEQVAGRSTTWHDSLGCSRNEEGRILREGEMMVDD
jgi:hypothetical protein